MLDALEIDPVALSIPIGQGFDIFWYGIIVTLGIAVGAWWAVREIRLRKLSVDEFYNGLILAVFSGYFFARLSYVVLDVIGGNGAQYDSFGAVINIRAGGVNILGGFIGAAVVVIIYSRLRGLNVWHYADVAGPALLLAQAIGRWGNFINQELYGPPTTLPWGILISPANRLAKFSDLSVYPETTRFHPTFLYESIWLLVGFIVLTRLNNRYRSSWRPGTLFGLFLIWWGFGRSWIELFRPDQVVIGNSFVTYSMVTALLLTVAGILVILHLYGRLPDAGQARRTRRRVRKPKPRRGQ